MTTATIETSQITALPEFNTSWKPQVGDIVENFGVIGRVTATHSPGHKVDGYLQLREVGGTMTWVAVADKCRPVR